jgi:hypothetical protein
MAVREFTDRRGVQWRVWDVTPEVMHPVTRAEDFMSELQDGWLVFEAKTLDARKRLAPYPPDWAERPSGDLEALLEEAEVVPRKRAGEVSRADDSHP